MVWGTIFQRNDGRWTASAIDGSYRRKWIYGGTRREIADRLKKIQADMAEGRPIVNERLSGAEYLNRWLCDVAKQRTHPMTLRGCENLVRLHVLPTLGRARLTKLSPQRVHSLITQKSRQGRLSPRTFSPCTRCCELLLTRPRAGAWSTTALPRWSRHRALFTQR